MKFILFFVFSLLVVNLGIDLLDNNMNQIIKDRTTIIQKTFK